MDQRKTPVPFPPKEHTPLLAVTGVGPTVVTRLEQMGFQLLAYLRNANAFEIVAQVSAITGSTCWKISPQALAATQSLHTE